jgi:hypothetical protein
MNKALPAILIALFLVGCGPAGVKELSEAPQPGATAGEVSVANPQVIVNDKRMTVSWSKVGQGAISGYNIYISEQPLAARYPGAFIDSTIRPCNLIPFPGDTDPDDGVEYFEATQLENGVRYYVSIRVVYPDGSLSAPSAEVVAACGPRGEIELPVRYQSTPDGYSFEKNAYTEANSVDNDLYFYSAGGRDYLASPRRLGGYINDTRFEVLPFKGSFDEVAQRLSGFSPSAAEDQVRVEIGDWVLARCERGTSALLQVKAMTGSEHERRVVLFFAYSAAEGELLF